MQSEKKRKEENIAKSSLTRQKNDISVDSKSKNSRRTRAKGK